MRKIIIKNSVFGIIQTIINFILAFISLPFFIKNFGIENYGIFSLISLISYSNTFLSLGLTNALLRFISEQGKSNESNIDILVNLIIQGIGILITVLLLLVYKKFILLKILNLPAEKIDVAGSLYMWIVLSNVTLFIGQSFKSILDALQKIYITSIQQIIYNILYWGLIVIAVWLQLGFGGVGFAIFISSLFWFLITLLSTLKEWGSFKVVELWKNFIPSIKKQLKYSLSIYISGIISFFYEPFSKVLVSHFVGINEVGFLDIAFRLKSYLWGVLSKFFHPLFPLISQEKDYLKIRNIVHDVEQKTFIVILPLIATLTLIMVPFISLWINENERIISIISLAIILSNLIGSSTTVPIYQFLMVKGHETKTILIQFTSVLVNLIVFLGFVNYLKFYSIIISNVVAIMSSFFLCLYYQKKYLNSLIFDSTSQVFKLILSLIILIISGLLIKNFIRSNIAELIIIPIFIFVLSIITFKLFKVVNENDIIRYFGKENIFSKALFKFYSS